MHNKRLLATLCLCSTHSRGAARPPHPEVGPWAIRQFLESLGDVRFIQSLKSFVASPTFKGTGIYGNPFDFEDLMATFLTCALERAVTPVVPEETRLIIGRPVAFAGHAPDEALAMRLLVGFVSSRRCDFLYIHVCRRRDDRYCGRYCGAGAKELHQDGVPPAQRREVNHRYELALWPADDPFEPRGGLDAVVESHGAELNEPELGHRVAADPLQQVLDLFVCRLSAVDVQTVTYAHMRVTSRFLAQILTAHGPPRRA